MFIPLHDQNALKSIKLQYVTLSIIAVNVLIFLLSGTPSLTDADEASAIYYSYGFVPAVVNDYATLPIEYEILPEQASYLTYAFFHAGFMHLAGNMLFLWVFGDNVEDAMGHFKFLLFYVACAIAGAFFHGLTFPDSQAPLIGASGAAAGVIGAYLMLHPKVKVWVLAFGRIPLRLSATWVLGAWIAFQLFNYLVPEETEVSFASHIGGFFAGAALIIFMRRSGVPLWDKNLPPETTTAATTDTPVDAGIVSTPPEDLSPHKWGRPKK
jgi:membrane associated rhomboid family serine protease